MSKWSYLVEMDDALTRLGRRAFSNPGDMDGMEKYIRQLGRAGKPKTKALAAMAQSNISDGDHGRVAWFIDYADDNGHYVVMRLSEPTLDPYRNSYERNREVRHYLIDPDYSGPRNIRVYRLQRNYYPSGWDVMRLDSLMYHHIVGNTIEFIPVPHEPIDIWLDNPTEEP